MNFIPIEKRSKKEQKKFHTKQRLVWDRSPISEDFGDKRKFNKKDRNKSKINLKKGVDYIWI